MARHLCRAAEVIHEIHTTAGGGQPRHARARQLLGRGYCRLRQTPKAIKTLAGGGADGGGIPVGRWRCYYDQDLEHYRNTNSTSLLRNGCNVLDFKRDFEFHPRRYRVDSGQV